jgi:hypothetical protein
MLMVLKSASLSDRAILDEYCRVYEDAHGREAEAYYLGYGWFLVNDEMLHSLFLLGEIKGLRQMMQRQYLIERQKLRLLRLIRRLRGL